MMTVDERLKELNPSKEVLTSALASLSEVEKNVYALIEIENLDMESTKMVTGLVKDVIRIRLRNAKKSIIDCILHKRICRYEEVL